MDKYHLSRHLPDDDDLPPPYSPSASDNLGAKSDRKDYDYKSPARELGTDGQILTEILDNVRSLLSSVEKMSPPPILLESTFVPAAALGPEWVPSDPGEKSRREVKRLFRIGEQIDYSDKKKSSSYSNDSRSDYTSYSDRSSGKGSGFADWGRFDDDPTDDDAGGSTLWWSDEYMAERLANELQPPVANPAKSASSRPPRPKDSTNMVRAFLQSFSDPSRVWPPRHPPSAGSTSRAVPIDEGIPIMTARAEETTFRRENEMGLWESKTGWAIVVRIRSRF